MDKERLIDWLGGCAQMLRTSHDNLLTKENLENHMRDLVDISSVASILEMFVKQLNEEKNHVD